MILLAAILVAATGGPQQLCPAGWTCSEYQASPNSVIIERGDELLIDGKVVFQCDAPNGCRFSFKPAGTK